MPNHYSVPETKQMRVVIDTDAACEADDPFAIAHALLSKKLEVRGILAEHFQVPGSTRRSYHEILTVLEAMKLEVPALMGEEGPLVSLDAIEPSEGARFLAEEARRESNKPLLVLCLGAITNVARALQYAPDIAGKMTIIWIGGHRMDVGQPDYREFNAGNDIDAVNLVLDSGVDFWQIPNNVYSTMHIGIAEIQDRIAGCGDIGKHLFENLNAFNNSIDAGWTAGETWSLGDSPAVGVALEPNCGTWVIREAPVFNQDTSYRFVPGRRTIRIYQTINSRFIIEDLISKLRIHYA